jgi:hypothetical protein
VGSRRGADRRERKVVALGSLVGLVLAVGAWLTWSHLAPLIDGVTRNLSTLAVSGLAAILCIPLLAAIVRHFRWPPREPLDAAPSWLLFLCVGSIAVVMRDAFEVLPATWHIASYKPAAILGFMGAGMALVGLVSMLTAIDRRISVPIRMTMLSIITVIVAVISAGAAARAAQNLGFLSARSAGHIHSTWLSFWPTGQTVLVQLLIAAACLIVLTGATLLESEQRAPASESENAER